MAVTVDDRLLEVLVQRRFRGGEKARAEQNALGAEQGLKASIVSNRRNLPFAIPKLMPASIAFEQKRRCRSEKGTRKDTDQLNEAETRW